VVAEHKRVRRFWHGEGDSAMPCWAWVEEQSCWLRRSTSVAPDPQPPSSSSPPPPPSPTRAASVADAIAITITLAGDDITPAQPTTAAQGWRPPSGKGGVGHAVSWSTEEVIALCRDTASGPTLR
jgi:hypothetical protein